MADRMRVPLPRKPGEAFIITEDDIAASVTALDTRYARRFSMDVAEEVLAKMGADVIPHVAQCLGEQVVREHQQQITAVVDSYLMERKWAEPIIRKAIEDSVRRFIFDMLAASPGEDTNG